IVADALQNPSAIIARTQQRDLAFVEAVEHLLAGDILRFEQLEIDARPGRETFDEGSALFARHSAKLFFDDRETRGMEPRLDFPFFAAAVFLPEPLLPPAHRRQRCDDE